MFFRGGCLKHERNKEGAGLARRGDGTTTEPIGASADLGEEDVMYPGRPSSDIYVP